MRMTRLGGWILLGVISGVVPLGGFWLTPGSPAWGLAPAPGPAASTPSTELTPGAYPYKKDYAQLPLTPCPRPTEKIRLGEQSLDNVCWNEGRPWLSPGPASIFFILNDHQYKYDTQYGQYEFNDSGFHPCGLEERFAGGGLIGQNSFYVYAIYINNSRLHKIVLERDPELSKQQPSAVVDSANATTKCKGSTKPRTLPAGDPPRYGFLWRAISASVAPAAPQRRGVNGEFWIAKQGDAPEDTRLWNCLVRDGNYPGVHFVDEATSADVWAAIGPDARFRATVEGGATYSWRLAPLIRCGILRTQAYRGSFHVPPVATSAEEKLVLACLVENEGFSSCRSWWLSHP